MSEENRNDLFNNSEDRNEYSADGGQRQEAPKAKTARRASAGRKWVTGTCMALTFGLIAGATMYGVNSVGSTLTKTGQISASAESAGSDMLSGSLNSLTAADAGIEIPQGTVSEGTTENLGSVESVVQECLPSVVTIGTVAVQEMQNMFGGSQPYEAQGAGTGVIVGQSDTELLIATNNHVVEGATSLSVGFIDDSTSEAVVKGTDTQHDLAVIAVKLESIPAETMSQIKVAKIGDSDALNLGEQVVVIGNALGEGQSVTSGYISAFGRELQLSDGKNTFVSSDLIQTDASINPGNSGGALLNMKGELVGINEAKTSYASNGATVDNVGYAIPISKAVPILQDLMTLETRGEKAENPGYLGVTCKDITADSDLVILYGFPEGVCFLEVLEGSPCAEAGLQKGDVLVKFDGRGISSFNDLKDILEYYSAGEQVELTVLRANNATGEYEEITRTVTLSDQKTIQNIYTAG